MKRFFRWLLATQDCGCNFFLMCENHSKEMDELDRSDREVNP